MDSYFVLVTLAINDDTFLLAEFLLITFFFAALSILFCAANTRSLASCAHAFTALVAALIAFFIPVLKYALISVFF